MPVLSPFIDREAFGARQLGRYLYIANKPEIEIQAHFRSDDSPAAEIPLHIF
jgi:hypothetical protein